MGEEEQMLRTEDGFEGCLKNTFWIGKAAIVIRQSKPL
jgi:hypothetical protein